MEPAQTIIRKLGGPSAVANLVGIHRTRVSSWQRAQARGGTGGRVPQGHIPTLLQAARERGVDLSADDFLPPDASPPTAPQSEPAQPEPVTS